MGYKGSNDVDDLEKLRQALVELTVHFGSVDAILAAVGLADLPTAQRYGILFGFMVFSLTITVVVALLVFGGTFKRISEQAETGQATSLLSSYDVRAQRALLFEELLESRERMKANYKNDSNNKEEEEKSTKTKATEKDTEGLTNLTKMLLSEAPRIIAGAPIHKNDNGNDNGPDKEGKVEYEYDAVRYIPPFYQDNYERAYRKCQDRPGGTVLSGRPEARFEAYARGFAGCGPYVSAAYRRSYGRMYESIACASLANDDKYVKLFAERPQDIVGRTVRLEALQADRHLQALYDLTSGEPSMENSSYDPQQIWSFQEQGPFASPAEMRRSFVFERRQPNEAAFGIVHSVTDRLWGALLLTHDDPKNLSIQLEPTILPPSREGSLEQLEACFLIMDRLFAYGYRRIQCAIDSQDAVMRKLVTRLGFTLEGVLYKHLIVKDSSRDSNIYSMLNSDWKKGARDALFKKLYGAAALRVDSANEKKEAELDEQQKFLAEKRLQAEKEKLQ